MIKRQNIKSFLIALLVFTSISLLLELALVVAQPASGFLGMDWSKSRNDKCIADVWYYQIRFMIADEMLGGTYIMILFTFFAAIGAFVIVIMSLIKYYKGTYSEPIQKSQLHYYDDSIDHKKVIILYICISFSLCGMILLIGNFSWLVSIFRLCTSVVDSPIIAITTLGVFCLCSLLASWILVVLLLFQIREYLMNNDKGQKMKDSKSKLKLFENDTEMNLNESQQISEKPKKKKKTKTKTKILQNKPQPMKFFTSSRYREPEGSKGSRLKNPSPSHSKLSKQQPSLKSRVKKYNELSSDYYHEKKRPQQFEDQSQIKFPNQSSHKQSYFKSKSKLAESQPYFHGPSKKSRVNETPTRNQGFFDKYEKEDQLSVPDKNDNYKLNPIKKSVVESKFVNEPSEKKVDKDVLDDSFLSKNKSTYNRTNQQLRGAFQY